jgi:glycerol-3-phosphate dehydrogenase
LTEDVSRLAGLEGHQFDVAVIGGGIIGCGIARDAAMRGLRVALFEQRDFGSGTTSGSTRIVHGGLRYLQMLDFRLVRLDLRERETLGRIAPHLVRPLEFMIPFFKGDGLSSLKLRAGLALYDALSYDKTLPSRRWLSATEACAAEDVLRAAGTRGAAAYHDARVDSPERLALENVIDAERHGARVFNYCQVVALDGPHNGVCGARVRDVLADAEALSAAAPTARARTGDDSVRVAARVLVNATGAWFDPVTERFLGRRTHAVRTTKGIHLVCPPLTSRALVLYSRVDGRLLFAIPRNGLTWIGTTDTDFHGDPAEARATRADVQYLLDSVRWLFPTLQVDDVLHTTAGVRALVQHRGTESSVSRMHKIVDGEPLGPPGMIAVLGGKITGYRAIAEEVTDIVCRRLGAGGRRSVTAGTPLPGASGPADPSDVGSPLGRLYGTRTAEVATLAASAPGLERPLSPRYPDIAAQVVYSVRHEHALRLSDFLRRRSLLGGSEDQGWEAAAPAAALMAAELGWPPSRVSEELESYRRDVARSQAFRED